MATKQSQTPSKTQPETPQAQEQAPSNEIWSIKSKDDQPFVRLGILFDQNPKEINVSDFSQEDRDILLGEPALEVEQGVVSVSGLLSEAETLSNHGAEG